MKKYCLSKGVIDYLYRLVYTDELERCSVLYLSDNRNGIEYLDYDISKEQIGIKVEGRQRCDSVDYHYIVHTHPISEYSYPSVEDIWRLIREPNIKLSVLATSWGIYTLKQKGQYKGEEFLNKIRSYKKGYEDEFKQWIHSELSTGIGKLEDKKRKSNNREYLLTPVEYQDINLYLNNISNHLDIEIKLYPWQYIQMTQP